ncbi:MAG: S-layer homology domain-containing protein [Clostridiales bacterium]|nr:S-layer homology domain-containing protein [Clostridiales bacterium]
MKKFVKILAAAALLTSFAAFSAVNTMAEETTEETAAETDEETEETTENPFSDVDPESEEGAAVITMYGNGYVTGYKDGTFLPDGNITRAELVRIVNQTLQFERLSEDTVNAYSDVEEEAWYYEDLMIAQEQGYVAGFPDGTFRPGENITREQFCTIISQLFSFEPLEGYEKAVSDEISEWASDYVYGVLSYGVMKMEDGNTFRATENITRGEVCLAMVNFIVNDDLSEIISSVISSSETDEEESETTTKSSSSGSSSSGGGGSSSGGSSSSSSSSTETTTVTDDTTETTTAASSSSGSSSSDSDDDSDDNNNDDNGDDDDDNTGTEVDSETLALLKTVYNSLQYAQVNSPNEEVRAIIKNIRAYIKSYLNDQSVDLDAAADDILSQYRSLSDENKTLTQNTILEYCSLSQLLTLKNVFFPDLSLS